MFFLSGKGCSEFPKRMLISIGILIQKVLAQIYASYYENPRELLLFFYYPSEEYLSCLMTEEQLLFYDEIDTRDLFGGNNEREKILIFEVI